MNYKKPTKAVITDAGFASRFLPLTKTMPKGMLPLGSRPIMQLVVEECVTAGISEIIIVATAEGKPIYEDYFNNAVIPIKKQLESQGKEERYEVVQHVLDFPKITVIVQDPSLPYGNGAPIVSAKDFLAPDEAFVAIYSDDVVFGSSDVKTLIEAYEQNPESKAIIISQEMPEDQWEKFGMIALKDEEKRTLSHIVEKPKTPDLSPSNLTSYGRYLLTPEVFEYLIPNNIGLDNELWTVDAITKLAEIGDVVVAGSNGKWMTTGDPKNYFLAQVRYFEETNPEWIDEVKKQINCEVEVSDEEANKSN